MKLYLWGPARDIGHLWFSLRCNQTDTQVGYETMNKQSLSNFGLKLIQNQSRFSSGWSGFRNCCWDQFSNVLNKDRLSDLSDSMCPSLGLGLVSPDINYIFLSIKTLWLGNCPYVSCLCVSDLIKILVFTLHVPVLLLNETPLLKALV